MSKIRDIRILGLESAVPDEQAYGMARGLTSRRGGGLVLLETEDGVTGIGEAWGPVGLTGAYLAMLKHYFVGTSVFAQRGVQQHVYSKHYHFGTQGALVALFSGIDIAAHDAMGKLLGVPVCDLIGGRQRDRVPVYGSGGYFTLDADQGAALERQLQGVKDQGLSAFKIKIGRDPADDEARVRMARRVLGDTIMLAVDSNGNYTLDQALESMRRIAPFNIGWYEEPLAPQDWQNYPKLRKRSPMPIATGEALYETHDFRRLVDNGCADVLQPDLALCGGLSVARFVGELAMSAHLRVSPHVWGTAVGLAAAVHWVASLPGYPHAGHDPTPTLVEYDTGVNPLRDTLLRSPLVAKNGFISVPTGPGLGIELDEKAIERFAVR